jgi:hypothetical protein
MKKTMAAIFAVTLSSLLLAPGCGDRTLTMNVDVLSFMDPETVVQAYGDDPAIPAGAPLPVVIDSDPEELNLSEGLSDLADVEYVDLYISSEFVNQTGSADVVFMVFVADSLTAPYTDNIPADLYVESEPLHLTGGVTDTLHVTVRRDGKLGELLTSDECRVGVRMKFDASGSAQAVTGVATLIRFNATVVAKRDTN